MSDKIPGTKSENKLEIPEEVRVMKRSSRKNIPSKAKIAIPEEDLDKLPMEIPGLEREIRVEIPEEVPVMKRRTRKNIPTKIKLKIPEDDLDKIPMEIPGLNRGIRVEIPEEVPEIENKETKEKFSEGTQIKKKRATEEIFKEISIPKKGTKEQMPPEIPTIEEPITKRKRKEAQIVKEDSSKEIFRSKIPVIDLCNDGEDSDILPNVRQSEHPKNYNCTICNKNFDNQFFLNAHIIIHNRETSYKCPIINCGKTFANRSNLKAHQRTRGHHEWKFKCLVCSKPFSEQNYLNRHTEAACKKYLALNK